MSTQPGPTVVAITGASGTIGSALSEALRARGDRVVHLVRRETRVAGIPRDVEERRWDPQRPTPAATLTGVDAVVHLAAPGIGERRWSKEYKARLREDRIAGTSSIGSPSGTWAARRSAASGLDPNTSYAPSTSARNSPSRQPRSSRRASPVQCARLL